MKTVVSPIGRGGRLAVLSWAVAVAMLATGCPQEADDAREAWFGINVTYHGTFPREADRKRLTVGPADAEALGVENPVIIDDFGSFVIRTTTIVEGDEKLTHCTLEPIVISDMDSGEVDHTVAAGTCLTERRMLPLE